MARLYCLAAAVSALVISTYAFASVDPADFVAPPVESKLDIWWHWSNGNISRDGIRKDLESMHENGIKRATILNVAGSGQYVPRVNFATDEWFEMFRYALGIADSLGMKIGVHNCDGWSTSGGPWIPVEKSMKTYTWSNVFVKGGRKVVIDLPEPESNLDYYEDYAVVAFPMGKPSSSFLDADPVFNFNSMDVDLRLCDSNPKSGVHVCAGDSITISFDTPYTADHISFVRQEHFSWYPVDYPESRFALSVSDNGVDYSPIGEICFKGINSVVNCEIPEVTARYFKLKCLGDNFFVGEMELLPKDGTASYGLGFKNFLARTYSGNGTSPDGYYMDLTDGAVFVPLDSVIDITGKMDKRGRLCWKAPEGEWCIIRFGYTTTAVVNAPATKEGTGLESDKLDAKATRYHFKSFPRKLVKAAGKYSGKTFQFILIDSWECAFPNWTEKFPAAFRKNSGYSIKEWIPLLCGYPEESLEASESFLHDYDCTIAGLIDRNYYREVAELSHRYGIEIHSEPIYGNNVDYPPLDALKAGSYCDLPMYEFWAKPGVDKQPCYVIHDWNMDAFPVDAAVLSGKSVVGAEAYTGYANFSELPCLLKPFGDYAYCSGINQLILHSYVHQPLDIQPHLTLTGRYGGHYNRNNPWWRFAQGWSLYHARIQYMLQQGEPVIDALYYIGDQFPQNFPAQMLHSDIPPGYRACSCNRDYLSKLVGAGYDRLIVPESAMIDDETEKIFRKLETSGVEIYHAVEGERIPFKQLPDFSDGGHHFRYTHRHLDDAEIYFVFNQEDIDVATGLVFRVSGCEPQIWNPVNGEIYVPSKWHENADGTTSVDMQFRQHQSLFFVFGDMEDAPMGKPVLTENEIRDMSVVMDFLPYYEAEIGTVHTDGLKSLIDFPDDDIRYFGGTVVYSITFDSPVDAADNLALDLGIIRGVAAVSLNGKSLGTIWEDNQLIRIDGPLLPVGNKLEVVLGTTLRNRMAGDIEHYGKPVNIDTTSPLAQLPSGNSDLKPSGLLGPIKVMTY